MPLKKETQTHYKTAAKWHNKITQLYSNKKETLSDGNCAGD